MRAPIEALQTSTGVKDAFAQHWIEDLLTRHREMKGEGLPLPEIQTKLEGWVKENGSRIYNAHLTTRGVAIPTHTRRSSHRSFSGFDPTQDSPIELLHTILLGVVKYGWYMTYSNWSALKKNIFATRLQATNALGLNAPSIRAGYIMQYANSLIGRQLKIIVQTMVFHCQDLLSPDMFALWKAIGELTALLWLPEIDDMEKFLVSICTYSTCSLSDPKISLLLGLREGRHQQRPRPVLND